MAAFQGYSVSRFEDQLHEMVIERQLMDRRIENEHRERLQILAQSIEPIVEVLQRAKRHLGPGFTVQLAAEEHTFGDDEIHWFDPECEGMVLARFDANEVPGVHHPYIAAFQVVNVSRDENGLWTGAIHSAGRSFTEEPPEDLREIAAEFAARLRGKNGVRRIYWGPLPPKNIIHRFEEALLHYYYLAAPADDDHNRSHSKPSA